MAESVPLGRNILNAQNYTAMIIDDSSTMRVAVKKILTSEDFNVISEAENGSEALAKLKALKEHPEIIFLDFEMPNMNGIDLLKNIRAMDVKSKVIIITSYSDKSVLGGFIKLGVDAYVVKPIERKILLERLAKIIGRTDYLPKTLD